MLQELSSLEGWAIGATDGTIGHVSDFFFDDQAWVVRYWVVDTGSWMFSRKVLLSPIAAVRAKRDERVLQVALSREQVSNSPDIDTEQPVSRQHERQFATYYGYPYYWGGTGYWGDGLYPALLLPGQGGIDMPPAPHPQTDHQQPPATDAHGDDPHLRSARVIKRYHVHASDGDIGHVEDLLIDDETWVIRYLVINTSNWWLGHRVLIAPSWIESISWLDSKVSVKMTRQSIKDAPPYEPGSPPDRAQEASLHAHHGYPGYWTDHERSETEISRF